jgi:subtilisin family serine protease
LSNVTYHLFGRALRIGRLGALIISASLLNTAPSASAADSAERAYHPTRIIIKPKAGSGRQLSALHAGQRNRVLATAGEPDIQIVELPAPGQVQQAVAAYQQSGEVEFAEPDYILRKATVPNDPRYKDLWALHNTGQIGGTAGADLGAEAAWSRMSRASNVVVAIIDSGIRYTHEDLADNMWRNPDEIPGNGIDDDNNGYVDDVHGINAAEQTGDPSDDEGHGTHVAGIIGAVGDNGKGTVGVAWQVQLMACKFMDSSGEGSTSDAVLCIDYARRKGAHIINASWGGSYFSYALQSAIKRAQAAGVIFVAAAGNETQNLDRSPSYPANYKVDNVISVAATTRYDLLADYSNYGAKSVSLAAPGSEILSTWNTSDRAYRLQSGTSMATPFVVGVLALARANFPDDTYLELLDRVTTGAKVLPGLSGKCKTGARVNLQQALGVMAAAGPVRLSVIPNAAAGEAQFKLQGDAEAEYVIEASNDLTRWVPALKRKAAQDGTVAFADPAGMQAPKRYYRARLVPVQ